jgi:hypothetical protein
MSSQRRGPQVVEEISSDLLQARFWMTSGYPTESLDLLIADDGLHNFD